MYVFKRPARGEMTRAMCKEEMRINPWPSTGWGRHQIAKAEQSAKENRVERDGNACTRGGVRG